MKFELQRVSYMPKDLKPGIIYMAEQFDIAMHLCACGCGSKVKTPLGPTEWSVTETKKGPSLFPSIGNWQLGCQSHYWIKRGDVVWAGKWTPEQIVAGRTNEDQRRQAYYKAQNYQRSGRMSKLLQRLKKVLSRLWGLR
jgi:hypothetical protein